ncbi:polyprenyl synthetase family protein [Streptomonospora litoralis]|uniref:(2E,6E)-farnesyl diphosphate synthase n=1 Tax=Streptomonospora litoralis TaxID=2498135 RepID=A0A4P6Q2M3_9ACTN|nr:polyprenyl synthetase family protein [Streptomonospora litoralis]QBI53491.1 (2E,6E)-farnesyl diphosphate synthase [Streptomonospora litoralis]
MAESARTYPPAARVGVPEAPPAQDDPARCAPAPLDGDIAGAVAAFLGEFFADRRAAVEERPPDDAADAGGGLDTVLDAEFQSEVVARLAEFTLSGGKRIRPVFAWWGWRAAGGTADGPAAHAALRAASALELVHACALIQDDVMDGSVLRRGRAALHAAVAEQHRRSRWSGGSGRYGESVAVLAGDLALVWADDMLDEALEELGARGGARVPWRRMRTELIAGQFLDLRAQAGRQESPDAALRVDRLKTAAYSVERPLHLGAALAGAGGGLVAALRGYGAGIGTAFQLRDDLLGLYGDPAVTGKPVGEDLREGKRTLLLALGVERALARGDAESAAALRDGAGEPELTAADAARLAALLEALGARAAVEERIARLVDEGLAHIRGAPMPGEARRALETMAVQAGTRIR